MTEVGGSTPGPLLGTGRAANVYDIGGGRVLRRYRRRPAPEVVAREAEVMRHLQRHGYPVPEVHDASGGDLVMQRLDGVSMLDDLARRPWRVGRHADTWAALHRRLAEVPVDDLAALGVAVRFGEPVSVLHLDLHPGNVMLTPDGPIVFDWTNAALGPAAADIAMSWIITASSTVDGGAVLRALAGLLRRRLVDRYVDRCGRAGAIAQLPTVAAHRLHDRNVRPEEAVRIGALVDSVR